MQYKNTFFLVYASLTLLVGAIPQNDAEATGTVIKSTKTETRVATAAIEEVDPAAGTGAADTGEDAGASGSVADESAGGSVAAAGDAAGDLAGDVNPTSNLGGSDTAASDVSSGGPAGGGAGDHKGEPGGSDGKNCDRFGRKRPGGEKDQIWSKFAAGEGHPHQPVARGWSGWFSGESKKDPAAKRIARADGQHDRMARDIPRDNIANSGPSWNHVRHGGIQNVKVRKDLGEERHEGGPRWVTHGRQ